MDAIKKSNFKQAIIYTKVLDDDTLVVIDENTAIRFVNIENLSTNSGFKASITHGRYSSNIVYFSHDAKYFISCTADAREAKLYNTDTRKNIAKVDRNQGEVSCVAIDPKSRYMFSGGDDGKTFVVDIKSGKLVFTLPNHVDTITDIVFTSNAQWVATASYDRNISLFNLAMMTPKFRLKAHSAPIIKLLFLNDFRLFSIDKNNGAIIWNIQTGKVITRLSGIHDDVTQVTKSCDGKFLFLGTKLGYVLVYELENYQLIAGRYIKLKDSITSLNFYDKYEHLIIGTKNGDVLKYNIYNGEKYIIELLKEKKYDQIEEYVEDNPLLKYTKSYEMLDVLWKRTVCKAKEFLGNSDKEKALALFDSFKNVPIKNQLIQKLMKEYIEFDKFVILVKNNKLALAYGLAAKYPAYKDSELYVSIEQGWRKSFAQAQKCLLDPGLAQKAKDILAPYRGITEKAKTIHELLINIDIYKVFRTYVSKKDFKMAFNLIDKNQFLLESAEYTAIMEYADKLYIMSHELLEKGDTHSAIKLLKILEDFPDYEQEAKEILVDAQNREKFFDAIEDGNIMEAYDILSKSDYLLDTDDGKKLIDLWDDDLEVANAYAVKGDVQGIETVLEKYVNISSKHMSLATVFAWCYISQLENAIKQKKDKAILEKGIKNYLFYFGLQEQMLSFFEIFKKYYPNSILDLEHQKKGSFAMWKPLMIVDSILIKTH